MARTWVTVPTFNEAGNVEPIVRAIVAELDRVCPGDYRVLVVDDESPDGTGLIADRLAAELAAVAVLHRRGKRGLGHAYLAGFARAVDEGAERVVVMDADFSHDPSHLTALLAASRVLRPRARVALRGGRDDRQLAAAAAAAEPCRLAVRAHRSSASASAT